MLKKVREFKPGDLVDLENDPYHADDPNVEFEYGRVSSVVQETPTCFLVNFNNFGCAAYPPDQEFEVDGNVDG